MRAHIEEALEQTGVSHRVLSQSEADGIVANVEERFCKEAGALFLWDDFNSLVSSGDPEAWTWIADYVGDYEEIALFTFESGSDAVVGFQIYEPSRIVEVIGECFGFEFYLTDPKSQFVLCLNHHNYLIATGAAEDWLADRVADNVQ